MNKPQRRFVLTLELEADEMPDLLKSLNDISNRISGGGWRYSGGGYSYRLTENPEMTRDKYIEQLDAYLNA